MTNGGGSVGDLIPPEKRAKAMSGYLLGPLLGPVVGPIIGGECWSKHTSRCDENLRCETKS